MLKARQKDTLALRKRETLDGTPSLAVTRRAQGGVVPKSGCSLY